MTEWNDGRLDDLSKRVDRIETKMDRGFERVDQRFDQVHKDLKDLHGRFEGLQRTIMQTNAVIIAALIGVIATQI